MKRTRDSIVKQRVASSRALRQEMDRSGEKVVRGLRDAAAAIRRTNDARAPKRQP